MCRLMQVIRLSGAIGLFAVMLNTSAANSNGMDKSNRDPNDFRREIGYRALSRGFDGIHVALGRNGASIFVDGSDLSSDARLCDASSGLNCIISNELSFAIPVGINSSTKTWNVEGVEYRVLFMSESEGDAWFTIRSFELGSSAAPTSRLL